MSVDRPDRQRRDTAPIPRVEGAEGEVHERRRAAITLSVLAVVAVAIVALLLVVLHHSGTTPTATATGFQQPTGLAETPTSRSVAPSATSGTSPKTSATSSAPASSGSSSTSSKASSSPESGATYQPSTRPVVCPTQQPCAQPDDVGDLVGALNVYRAAHGLPLVTGSVTPAATTCAVTSASECTGSYFWEPGARDGQAILTKMLSFDHDTQRLVAPGLKSIQVGWAYVPASQSFYAALIVPS